MFGRVKNYFVLLGPLLWLVNCAPVGPTGKTAASHPAGGNVCGNDATFETPQQDVRTYPLKNYGELEVVKPAAEEIVANQPFEISLTFTAKQTIAPITERDLSARGGINTHDAIIRVIFVGSNIASYRRVPKAGAEFVKSANDNNDYSMIYLKEMQAGDSFSMTYTVTPKKSFDFDVTIVQKDSPTSFFGGAQRIEVDSNGGLAVMGIEDTEYYENEYGKVSLDAETDKVVIVEELTRLAFTFEAKKDINPLESDHAVILMLFPDATFVPDGRKHSNFYKNYEKSGSQYKIEINQMKKGDKLTFYFKVHPKEQFTVRTYLRPGRGGAYDPFVDGSDAPPQVRYNAQSYCDSEESKRRMHSLYSNREFNAKEYSNTKGKITVTTARDHVYANERNTLAVKFTALRSVSEGERINVVFPNDNFGLAIAKLGRATSLTDYSSSINRHYRLNNNDHIYLIFTNAMSVRDSFTINFPFVAQSGSLGYRIESEIGRSGAFQAFKSGGNHPAVRVVPKKCP